MTQCQVDHKPLYQWRLDSTGDIAIKEHRFRCCGWVGDWCDSLESAYDQAVEHTKRAGVAPPAAPVRPHDGPGVVL